MEKRGAISREKLYEEVWAEPMTAVAKRYEVSGSFLARICSRLNVPRPARGYWAMVAAGKKVKKVPLPSPKPGDELEWARNGRARVAQYPLPTFVESSISKPQKRKPLPELHPILQGAKQLISEGKESDSGLLKPRKYKLVDLICSKPTLDHALDIANVLYLSLEKRGHSVVLEPHGQHLRRRAVEEREKGGRRQHEYSDLWHPSSATLVFVGTVAYGLTIFEMTEHVEVEYQNGRFTRVSDLPIKKTGRSSYSHSWRTTRDLASGRLCVQVYSPYPRVEWVRQWREVKTGDFPRKLRGLVKDLEAEAGNIVRLVEEGERKAESERQRWEAQKLESQRKESERLRLKSIEESHAELLKIIHDWGEVKTIESFFSEIERHAAELGAEEKEIILERLRLGREMLGCTDAGRWIADWKTPAERLTAEKERLAKLYRW